MSERNIVLEHIFDAIATRLSGEGSEFAGACKWNDQGELYRICKCAVLRGPSDGSCKEGELTAYDKEIPLLQLSVPQNVRPECLLDPELFRFVKGGVQMPDGIRYDTDEAVDENTHILFVHNPPKGYMRGVWFVSSYGKPEWTYDWVGAAVVEGHPEMAEIELNIHSLPSEVNDFLGEASLRLSDFNAGLVVTKTRRSPVLVMSTDDSLLYIPLAVRRNTQAIKSIFMPDGAELFGDGWSENKRQYTKLSRRKTMPRGLPNPIKPQAQAQTQPLPAAAQGAQTPAQATQPLPAAAAQPAQTTRTIATGVATPAAGAANPMRLGGSLLRNNGAGVVSSAAVAATPAAPAKATEQTEAEEKPAVAPADGTNPAVAAAVTAQVDTSVQETASETAPAEGVQLPPEAENPAGAGNPAEAEQPAQAAQAQESTPEGSPAPATPQPPRRNHTPRPVKAAGIDYAKILEMLGAPDADYSSNIEGGMQAVRQLRDIAIAVARHTANITTVIGEDALNMARVKAALKGVKGLVIG